MKYNINENETLLILKIDYFEEGLLTPIIEYEVYNSKTKEKLDLIYCKDIKIDISIPVIINEEDEFKHNLSSDYYNNICFTYTTENGTDITLNNRKNEFINKNMSLCEESCEYNGYNSNYKKAQCKCQTKTNFPLLSDIKINKNKLLNNFLNFKSSLNINIMKCYYLVFSLEGIKYNIENYLIFYIILINIILTILFILKGYNSQKIMINKILKNKIEYNDNINNLNKYGKNNNRKNSITQNKGKTKNIVKDNKNNPPKNFKKINKNLLINIIGINDNKFSNSNSKFELQNYVNKKLNQKSKSKMGKDKFNKNNDNIKTTNYIQYNDYELNTLVYKEALIKDKRTYFQYYLSLLKQKNLLIFSFYTYKDYNSKIIKICLFLFSFSLYYSINALFFTDATMDKIYESSGAFDFIYQIPQILYSTIISNIINTIITYLALSEKMIIKQKNENKISRRKIFEILKCLKIKYIFFFILSFLFLIIFWYYLSCFGAVYKNTQNHLIKDTLISFGLSLFYPFIINLLPGILRINSLKTKKKDKECIYKISKIIQLL